MPVTKPTSSKICRCLSSNFNRYFSFNKKQSILGSDLIRNSRKASANVKFNNVRFFHSSRIAYAQSQVEKNSDAETSESFVQTFRSAMSLLASPACIITTAGPKDSNTNSYPHPRGLTVSSFSSLSIKPRPLVTFNVQLPSHAADSMRPFKTNDKHTRPIFAINILPATGAAAKSCRAFAGGLGRDVNPFTHPSISPLISFEGIRSPGVTRNGGNEGTSTWRSEFLNVPVYKHAKAVIYCTQHEAFSVQDHEIWVARVLHVEINNNSTKDENKELIESERKEIMLSESASSLLYQNRRFHVVGPNLSE
ncbi:uncharacterized protein SAPINGB_P004699 [Magnusiomyces paraingens]|uniref:Flavin reductase like domain-containing protein n=1 Tax=Magnusiomyces paraingens TaxID=2606893 RepID=A0A5E8BVL5_9ASCO|nr:uncharacterized protein SAPINGB_P004699 [Saprochaete ingens]VVT55708.1 unnamed protein product [Saprochaete ingens]